MGDRLFLKTHCPPFTIYKHNLPVTLRGIGANRHTTDKWTVLSLFIKGQTPNRRDVFIKFTKEFYIVDNLKANLLIGMDIIGPEKATINIPQGYIAFRTCGNARIPVQATARDNIRIRRVVRAEKY